MTYINPPPARVAGRGKRWIAGLLLTMASIWAIGQYIDNRNAGQHLPENVQRKINAYREHCKHAEVFYDSTGEANVAGWNCREVAR